MRHRRSLFLGIAFASLLILSRPLAADVRLPAVFTDNAILSRPLVADVRLPAVFTDNAVLQRDIPVPVWGWADQGEAGHGENRRSKPRPATPDAKTGKWIVKSRSPAGRRS